MGFEQECGFIYVVNFFQEIVNRVQHPFFQSENPDGIHETGLYCDPRQLMVCDTNRIYWTPLKLDSKSFGRQFTIKESTPDFEADGAAVVNIDISKHEVQFMNDSRTQWHNVMDSIVSEGAKPTFTKIYDISHEGYQRKEINILVEDEMYVRVYKLAP